MEAMTLNLKSSHHQKDAAKRLTAINDMHEMGLLICNGTFDLIWAYCFAKRTEFSLSCNSLLTETRYNNCVHVALAIKNVNILKHSLQST